MMPVGVRVSMLRARSGVREFLSFIFNECSLYSCDASFTRSIFLVYFRSSCSVSIMVSGMLK
jgi:hypothetical protein